MFSSHLCFLLCELLLQFFGLLLIFNIDELYILPVLGKVINCMTRFHSRVLYSGEVKTKFPLVPQECVDEHHLSLGAFSVSIFSSHQRCSGAECESPVRKIETWGLQSICFSGSMVILSRWPPAPPGLERPKHALEETVNLHSSSKSHGIMAHALILRISWVLWRNVYFCIFQCCKNANIYLEMCHKWSQKKHAQGWIWDLSNCNFGAECSLKKGQSKEAESLFYPFLSKSSRGKLILSTRGLHKSGYKKWWTHPSASACTSE